MIEKWEQEETPRKLASIQKILALSPIPEADAIEKAKVLGWDLVVKKGEFKVGDLCIYIEIDSILPERPEFEFMRARGFRVKTVRLKKQISQGICFPLSILKNQETLVEGQDVTELLGIKKYVMPIPTHLSGQIKGNFPSFIIKTDETRIQAYPRVLERHRGKKFFITEKLDGTSATFYIRDGVFGICSRNLELQETEENTHWKVARKYDIENKLKSLGKNIALQGEIIGNEIQKNKYKFEGIVVRFFNLFDIDAYRYYNYKEFTETLKELKLEAVPIVQEEFVLSHTIEDLVEMSKGKSMLYDTLREGLVFRPHEEERDDDLGRLSFKVINLLFLLENNE